MFGTLPQISVGMIRDDEAARSAFTIFCGRLAAKRPLEWPVFSVASSFSS
jgi:hypothetical protein